MNVSFTKLFFHFVSIIIVVIIAFNIFDIPGLLEIKYKVDSLVYVLSKPFMSPYLLVAYKQKQQILTQQSKCSKKCHRDMKILNLFSIDELLLAEDSHKLMFFLETSGASSLTIRQACAVESAARISARKVFLLLTSQTINICEEKVAGAGIITSNCCLTNIFR